MNIFRAQAKAQIYALLIVGFLTACAGQGTGALPMMQQSMLASSDELSAVQAAVARFNPHSIREDREYIGSVIRKNQEYYFMVAGGQPGQDAVSARLVVPAGYELVALWHTHGGPGLHRDLFSPEDVALVERTGLPFYMADASGTLRVLNPGAKTLNMSQARREGLPRGLTFAAGERVAGEAGLARLDI